MPDGAPLTSAERGRLYRTKRKVEAYTGICCPACGGTVSAVTDSRGIASHSSIRRRRKCTACSYRFTTYETVELPAHADVQLQLQIERVQSSVTRLLGLLKSDQAPYDQ